MQKGYWHGQEGLAEEARGREGVSQGGSLEVRFLADTLLQAEGLGSKTAFSEEQHRGQEM